MACGSTQRLVAGGVPALELSQYLKVGPEGLYFSQGQSLVIRESPLTGMYCHGKLFAAGISS